MAKIDKIKARLEREFASLRSPSQYADKDVNALIVAYDRQAPFVKAVRTRHNGYNAEMRAELPALLEPATPEQALDELIEEANDIGKIEARLEAKDALAAADELRDGCYFVSIDQDGIRQTRCLLCGRGCPSDEAVAFPHAADCPVAAYNATHISKPTKAGTGDNDVFADDYPDEGPDMMTEGDK